jgi:hypothetical protein
VGAGWNRAERRPPQDEIAAVEPEQVREVRGAVGELADVAERARNDVRQMRAEMRLDAGPVEPIGLADGRDACQCFGRGQALPPSSARTAPEQKLDAADAK